MDQISPLTYFNDYVERAFADFKQSQMDEYLARSACMWTFHMHDIFFKAGSKGLQKDLGGSQGVYKKRLLDEVEGFKAVETVCNVSKHVNTRHAGIRASTKNVRPRKNHLLLQSGGKLLMENGDPLLLESSSTYLTVGDEDVNILIAVESVVAFWKTELERIL